MTLNFKPLEVENGVNSIFQTQLVSGNRQIFGVSKLSATSVQLTTEGDNYGLSSVSSPAKLLFVTTRLGSPTPYVMNEDGTQQVRAVSSQDLVCWGDSLTAGGGGGSGYASQLNTLYNGGRLVTNKGVGGTTSAEIAARQGGLITTFTIPSGTIPASGTITLANNSQDPCSRVGSINGTLVYGNQAFNGTLTRTPSTGALTGYTFTLTQTGSSVSVGTNPVTWLPEVASLNQDTVLIRVGQNDANFTQLLTNTDAIVNSLTPFIKKFLVIGLFFTYNDAIGTSGRNNKIAANNTLLSQYGNRFVDIGAYNVLYQQQQYAANNARFIFPAATGTDNNGTTQTITSSNDQINVRQVNSLCVNGGIYSPNNYGYCGDLIHLSNFGCATEAAYIKSILDSKGW